MQKRRIINPLKHAYWNSVWNLSWAWVLYVGKVGGIWGGGKEKKNPWIWIMIRTCILTLPHRYDQSIKVGLKQCRDFLLYFQFGVNLINHSI